MAMDVELVFAAAKDNFFAFIYFWKLISAGLVEVIFPRICSSVYLSIFIVENGEIFHIYNGNKSKILGDFNVPENMKKI